MLPIRSFDAARGGNTMYKALSHPLAAPAIRTLYDRLAARGPVALYDPSGAAEMLAALHPLDGVTLAGVFVQDVAAIGAMRAGQVARPATEMARSGAASVLVAAFDAGRLAAQAGPWMPQGAEVATLDEAALPPALRTRPERVLDPLNFATNLALFRDGNGLRTRLVTANYWAGYGARDARLWLSLFDSTGRELAQWEEKLPDGAGGVAIDSAEVRARFGLPPFVGHLFMHAIGAAGHDVVKYVLDVMAEDGGASLSGTHDANPWPAERYAGVPAPDRDEQVLLWLENPHPVAIPPGAVALGRMGGDALVAVPDAVPPFGACAVDVGLLLPSLAWPSQLELHAGNRVVRPRYEVVQGGRRRLGHANVERTDLAPDPAIAGLGAHMGRGFLLPFPVLDPARFRSLVLPTPMSTTQQDLPLAIEVFAADGRRVAQRFLGCLPRDHAMALDLDEMLGTDARDALAGAGGHAELTYDFRDGGGADGWLHAIFRYVHRQSGHVAESSFGSHIYNTLLTWRGEPQSYSGPPPGLSTRLFLGLDRPGGRSFAVLIHPRSDPSAPVPETGTSLLLHDSDGVVIGQAEIEVPPGGSRMVRPGEMFDAALQGRAGERGYVLVRNTSCRLFGYQGLEDGCGGFSFDHMFGF